LKKTLFKKINLREIPSQIFLGDSVEIKVIVSMDWEGTSLESVNATAIKDFKARWNVPIVHFFNPTYYTNPLFSPKAVNSFINNVFEKDDEIALHLHTPKHFLTKAGVTPRLSPCFSHLGDFNVGEMSGQEVMLLAYRKEEVKALLEKSLSLFKQNGLPRVQSFRAGGWMADERVWEALIEVGLPIESSAGNSFFLKGSSWEGDNLERYSELLWGNLARGTRPFSLETFSGSLIEIPNNLGAIDYWNNTNIYQVLGELLKADEELQSPPLLVINSHQETAAENMHKLNDFLTYLHGVYGNRLSFITNRDAYLEHLGQGSVLGTQHA
jgi:hypothetical protein